MEIDSVHMSAIRKLEEDLSLGVREKLETPEEGKKIDSVLRCQRAKESEEALSLAVQSRPTADSFGVVQEVTPIYMEIALAMGIRKELEKPEKRQEVDSVQGWQPAEELEEALSLAVRSGLVAEKVEKFLYIAACCNLMDYDIHSLAVKNGLKEEDALSLVNSYLPVYKRIFGTLHEQLLASFDRRLQDLELCVWKRPPRSVIERIKYPGCPFLLFKIKASAKNAKIFWWQKKYSRFPPERPGYNGALRVARLAVGRDGFHLEEAGKDGQPGALSCCLDKRYLGWPPRKVGVLKDGWVNPLNEVAVIKRLPGGDGISIMSYVNGLGVKLGDFLFVLHRMSCTVALSFTERSFYVSSKFKEETLYAVPGIDFIDITSPMQNLIKKLYKLYEQEEQDKKIMQQKQDHQDQQELMRQQEELMRQQEELRHQLEEQERKKLEDIRRRRYESWIQKCRRKEIRELVHRIKDVASIKIEQGQHDEYEEDCFGTGTLLFVEESNQVQPSDEELWQREERRKELLEDAMKSVVENDLLKLGRGGDRGSKGTEEPSSA